MRWSPFLNAACAAAYVLGIGLVVQLAGFVLRGVSDSVLDPIAALSLLVFSAALMGFLFFYRPVVLLLDNQRKEAVSYFLKTLVLFGVVMAIALAIMFAAQLALV